MFSQETADAICELIAEGKSLRKACELTQGAKPQTVLDWKNDPANAAFAGQYARARETGYLLLADEIIDISDDGQNDSYVDEDGQPRTNVDVIARSKLRVDSRKWMLSKMLPKVYGDKLDLNHAGDLTVKIVRLTSGD